jgi:hypothetical protein
MASRDLIFQQGDEAAEALAMLDQDGPAATTAYLAEVAAEGDLSNREVREQSAAGTADRQYVAGGYVLPWDRGGNYIGLEQDTSHAAAEPDAGPEAG